MANLYSSDFLKKVRNEIKIDWVIQSLLKLETKYSDKWVRFCCPVCYGYHTATQPKTNLARCFNCGRNFNPIDLVMTVGKCDFIEAVEYLKKKMR